MKRRQSACAPEPRFSKGWKAFDKLFAFAYYKAKLGLRWLARLAEDFNKRVPHCLKRKPVQLTFDPLETRMCMSTVSFSAASFSVLQNAGSLSINVNLSSTATASVNYATSDLTAAAGTDYTSESGTLNWTSGGTTTQSFSVPILNDSLYSANLTFAVTLSSPTAATLGANSYDVVTIKNSTTGGFTLFTTPTGSASQPLQIVSSGSNLWSTEEAGNIGKMSQTGTFTEYPVASGFTPVAITLGPDGNVWYTSWYDVTMRGVETTYGNASKITSGGTITDYNLGSDTDLPSIASEPGNFIGGRCGLGRFLLGCHQRQRDRCDAL